MTTKDVQKLLDSGYLLLAHQLSAGIRMNFHGLLAETSLSVALSLLQDITACNRHHLYTIIQQE